MSALACINVGAVVALILVMLDQRTASLIDDAIAAVLRRIHRAEERS